MLPRAIATLGTVRNLKPPPTTRRRVDRFQRTLARLVNLYQLAVSQRATSALKTEIERVEALETRQAVAAGIGACTVSGHARAG